MFSRLKHPGHRLLYYNRSSLHYNNNNNVLRAFATQSDKQYDIVVIGGGPGGYVAAIKAAQLGLRVACVESRGSLGGTCLNIGCIPSKALLNASHQLHEAHTHFSKIGLDGGEQVKVNLTNLMAYKNRAVTGLTKGIESLFKKNKVDYVKGVGKITSKNTVIAEGEQGTTTLNTQKIIIATGSIPASLPGLDVDEKLIVTSTGALELKSIPKEMIIVGGGVIGLEMGSVWARLGSKVTVVEYLDRIIPGTDTEIATQFKKTLEKQGFKFRMSTKVTGSKKNGDHVILTVESAQGGGKPEEMKADVVLVATGRIPYTDKLGLQEMGINVNKRRQIETDKHFKTNIDNIYAIGDVIAGPMLAHKAEEEGIAAAEIIAGKAGHVNYNAIPSVIYTWPEVAVVGQSEDDAKKAGISYKIQKFPFLANSRAKTNDDAEGLIKVVVDSNTDRILGLHILGPGAGELIAEATLAMEYGASAEDVARTCHAHPTLSEAVKEACMPKPIHF